MKDTKQTEQKKKTERKAPHSSKATDKKIQETHEMRAFDLGEITQFSCSAGFEILHSEEWMTQLLPSAKTWGVCSIVRKI